MAEPLLADSKAPKVSTDAVLMPSESIPEGSHEVNGFEFNNHVNKHINVADILEGMTNMGFQASNLSKAVQIINEMV